VSDLPVLDGPLIRLERLATDGRLGHYLTIAAKVIARDLGRTEAESFASLRQLLLARASEVADDGAADRFGYYLAGIIDGYAAGRRERE
jgi:hypothetical protein